MADDALDARYCAETGLLCGSLQWLDAPWCGCAHCHEYKRTHQPTVAPPGVSCTCDPIVDYQLGEAHHRDHCAVRRAALGLSQTYQAAASTFAYSSSGSHDTGAMLSTTFQPRASLVSRAKVSNELRLAQERIRQLEAALAPGDVTVVGGRAIELEGWGDEG